MAGLSEIRKSQKNKQRVLTQQVLQQHADRIVANNAQSIDNNYQGLVKGYTDARSNYTTGEQFNALENQRRSLITQGDEVLKWLPYSSLSDDNKSVMGANIRNMQSLADSSYATKYALENASLPDEFVGPMQSDSISFDVIGQQLGKYYERYSDEDDYAKWSEIGSRSITDIQAYIDELRSNGKGTVINTINTPQGKRQIEMESDKYIYQDDIDRAEELLNTKKYTEWVDARSLSEALQSAYEKYDAGDHAAYSFIANNARGRQWGAEDYENANEYLTLRKNDLETKQSELQSELSTIALHDNVNGHAGTYYSPENKQRGKELENEIAMIQKQIEQINADIESISEDSHYSEYVKELSAYSEDALAALDAYNESETRKNMSGVLPIAYDIYLNSTPKKDFYEATGVQLSDDEFDALAQRRKRVKNRDEAIESAKMWQEQVNSHPIYAVSSSIASVGTSLVSGIAALPETVRGAVESDKGWEYGVDRYSAWYAPTRYTRTVRDTVAQGIDSNIGQFIYQTGMSMLDSAAAMGVSYLTGGLAGLSGSALQNTMGAMTKIIMSSSAAANSIYEGLEKGYSNEKALLLGISAGLIEAASETWSIDKILDSIVNETFIKAIGKSALAEGSEELVSNWGNRMMDVLVNKSQNEIYQTILSYQDQGYSSREALAYALVDMVGDDAQAFLGGALSGAAMATVGTVGKSALRSGVRNAINARQNTSDVKATIQNNRQGELVNKALDILPSDSNAYKVAKKYESVNYEVTKQDIKTLTKAINDHYRSQISNTRERAIKTGIAEILQKRGVEDTDTFSSVAYKALTAQNLTNEERQLVKKSDDIQAVMNIAHEMNDLSGFIDVNGLLEIDAVKREYITANEKVTGKQMEGIAHPVAAGKGSVPIKIDHITQISEDGSFVVEDAKGNAQTITVEDIKDQKSLGGLARSVYENAIEIGTVEAANAYIQAAASETSISVTAQPEVFNAYYTLGQSGLKITGKGAEMFFDLSKPIYAQASDNFKNIAYNAGKSARNKKNGVSYVGITKEDAVQSYRKKLGKQADKMIELIDKIGEKYGVDIIIADLVKGYNGGHISGTNTIILGLDIESGLITCTLGHEMFHYLREQNTQAAGDLQSEIISWLKENGKYDSVYAQFEKRYIYNILGMSESKKRAYLNEEIAADSCFDALSNDQFLADFVYENRNNQSFIEKVVAFIDDIRKMIGRVMKNFVASSDDILVKTLMENQKMLDHINERFREMLNVEYTQDNKNDTNDSQDVRFSKEYQQAKVNENIVDLIAKVRSGNFKANEKVDLGIVPSKIAEKLYELTGVNVKGFKVSIEARQLDHIIKDHGPQGRSDHSMANTMDIAKMEYALSNPDEISRAGRTQAYSYMNNGRNRTSDTVLYEKIVGDKSYYVVEAVADTNARTLYVVSAFIGKHGYKKGFSQLIDAQSPNATPKNGSVVNPNNSISQEAASVNTYPTKNDIEDAGILKNQMSHYIGEEADARELLHENEALKSQIDLLKKEFLLSKRAVPSEKALKRYMRDLMHRYTVQYDSDQKAQAYAAVSEIYDYLANTENPDIEIAQQLAYRVAQDMIDHSGNIRREEYDDLEIELRKTLRQTGLSLSDAQKSEIAERYDGFSAFIRAAAGTIKIKNDSKLTVSDIMEEAREIYGIESVNEDEFLTLLLPAMKASAQAHRGVFVSEYGSSQLSFDAATELARELLDAVTDETIVPMQKTFADKQQTLRYNALKRQRLEYQKKIQELRESKEKTISALTAEYQERLHKLRAAKNEKFDRAKRMRSVKTLMKSISSAMVKNDKENHIADALKPAVQSLFAAIDGTDKVSRSLAKQVDTIRQTLYNADGTLTIPDIDLPDGYAQMLTNLADSVEKEIGEYIDLLGDGENVLNLMNAEQLRQLGDMLKVIKKAMTSYDRILNNARYHKIDAARASTKEAISLLGKRTGKKRNTADRFFNVDNITPVYFFERLGDGGRAIFQELTDGAGKLAFNVKEILNFMEDLMDGHDKAIQSWSSDSHEIKVNGKTFKMTTAQIMCLYELSKRKSAYDHLYNKTNGGIRTRIYKKDGMQNGTNPKISVTEADVKAITDTLTADQKRIADALQNYMATTGAKWGNEVSMLRWGINFFLEDGYFTMTVDKGSIEKSEENFLSESSHSNLYGLLNRSFNNKLTAHANNALVIDNIFDVFAEHMYQMAVQNALGPAILDANRWWERTDYTETGAKIDDSSVKKQVEKYLGAEMVKYYDNLISDLNGKVGDLGTTSPTGKFISLAKVSKVAGSLKVAVLQPLSYVRAGYVINAKYLLAAANSNSFKKNSDIMKKSGIAIWKSLGFYDASVSRNVRDLISGRETLREKAVNSSMALAERADEWTWRRLWEAVALEAEDNGYTRETQEFDDYVTRRFDEVIYKTQVVDSVLTRSQLMRSKHDTVKIMTAYMSEAAVSYNVTHDAFIKVYEAEQTGIGKREAWENAGRALIVMFFSTALEVLTDSLAGAWRDEKDKDMLTKIKEQIPKALLDDFPVLSELPFIADLWSILVDLAQGENITDIMSSKINDMTAITEAIMGFQSIGKAISGSAEPYKAVYDMMVGISSLTGVPFGNITREVVSLWNNMVSLFDRDDLKIRKYEDTNVSRVAEVDTKNMNSDEAVTYLKGLYNSASDDDEKSSIKEKISSFYRDKYLANKDDWSDIWNIMYRTKLWSGSELNVLFRGWQYKDETDETDFNKTTDLYNAFRDGIGIEEAIAEYESFSSNKPEPDNEAKSAAKGQIKQNFLDGNIDNDTAINYLQKYADEKRSDAKEMLTGWEKTKTRNAIEGQFRNGALDRGNAIKALRNAGYDKKDAEEAVDNWQADVDDYFYD